MLSIHLSLAGVAVAALVLAPRNRISAAVVAAAAALDIALGARVTPALGAVAPLVAFLTAALTLAALIASSGLADRAAVALARRARGNGLALYALVCGLCALLTAIVSLDGAVVLIVPLIIALHRRYRAPVAPLLLGAVAVANAASIAVPQGNPTNLVVINHLRLSPAAFTEHMLAPGLAAAAICALAVALSDRRALATTYQPPQSLSSPLARQEQEAALALGAAALTAWTAPLIGIAPWWPFTAVVAAAVLLTRNTSRLRIPWRITVQIAGLVILAQALGVHPPSPTAFTLPTLLLVAIGTGTLAALINNLPASVWATSLLAAGPLAYAATIGLAVGALAAPQGSVATIIAADLAGPTAPPLTIRRLAPLAIAALLAATLLLKITL
ncbi:MAG TPA: SLC13 family permease [Solirubrobacteraceae bacterium]|nr:SLC13 family permease [Solirubrobacteraceae bacterium]